MHSGLNSGGSLDHTLIYDADCGFCTRSAKWLGRSGRVSIKPWRGVRDLTVLGLNEQMVSEAAFWVNGDKVAGRGEVAIARALIRRGGAWAIAGRIILVPGVRQICASGYAVIAKNRHAMPGGTASCKLPR
ncbi:thiol-disulfide oxidoreductase DCC family protein [Arthrobacter sp. CAN_A214]|uniref:thiol-disulfide oxidoreductase DCC family protein n=1 Tax=Arthrobacter sp. CAN_A214 TaxID=2787720 RepID=UPI003FA44C5A